MILNPCFSEKDSWINLVLLLIFKCKTSISAITWNHNTLTLWFFNQGNHLIAARPHHSLLTNENADKKYNITLRKRSACCLELEASAATEIGKNFDFAAFPYKLLEKSTPTTPTPDAAILSHAIVGTVAQLCQLLQSILQRCQYCHLR